MANCRSQNGSADTSNFDEEFTKEQPTLTPVHGQLSSRDQTEFNGFSWVSLALLYLSPSCRTSLASGGNLGRYLNLRTIRTTCMDSCILCVYFTCATHITLFRLDCVSCTKSKYRRACYEVANDNTIFPSQTNWYRNKCFTRACSYPVFPLRYGFLCLVGPGSPRHHPFPGQPARS